MKFYTKCEANGSDVFYYFARVLISIHTLPKGAQGGRSIYTNVTLKLALNTAKIRIKRS